MSNREMWDNGFSVGIAFESWWEPPPEDAYEAWLSGFRMGCIAREKGYGPIARKSQ